jgi:ferric-dicitrate binding protein FerR (iron transport regulator)
MEQNIQFNGAKHTMDKDFFIELLQKYLNDEATEEEQLFIINYYNLFQNEPDVMDLLSIEEKEALKVQMHNVIWHTISKTENSKKKIGVIRKWSIGIAAAAILFAILRTGIVFHREEPGQKTNISVVFSGKENRLVHLSDGSMIFLCAGSELNYPSSFDKLDKREVYLKGQAFFDIQHNESKPFVVQTGKVQTTVLGTAFNIKAFPRETDITVTVKRGRVKVCDQHKVLGIITYNQQITYNKQATSFVQRMVSDDGYLSWEEQDLSFDNVTVAEAAMLLEHRYNVKILINDQSTRFKRFTTTFPKNETLEQALKSICEFNGFVYKYDKQKATVVISNKNSSSQ